VIDVKPDAFAASQAIAAVRKFSPTFICSFSLTDILCFVFFQAKNKNKEMIDVEISSAGLVDANADDDDDNKDDDTKDNKDNTPTNNNNDDDGDDEQPKQQQQQQQSKTENVAKPAVKTTSTTATPAVAASEWTPEQQKTLEEALAKYPGPGKER
jgi:hypothetical protein